MDKNHGNIHKQEGNTTKPKKNLTLRDAIIGIITALLVAHFGAKFFESVKKETISMLAIVELRAILKNVKNNYITFATFLPNKKEAFWKTAGVALDALPWWSVCFEIELDTSKDAKINIAMSDFKNDEKCQALYEQPQVLRWLSAPIYITNKRSDDNASTNKEEDFN
ncbi:MAG: hypothetical protein MR658_05535 [Campylobacter sp.]|uniref:hypothetical protein n=1 Tax=Campylobacter sp. TaxID=205 RepID=UPI002A38944D|nr:hypothetical protein [Campylobacter sp.]MDD6925003.1 hypothetical protein [Campylobacteraceae bacterium]MCI6178270.1 hypothetical protein [Campylobacter sp.]MCI7501156.1 hypothetical protein [Campylobacter sp.]MDD7090474.1 hypothetical protein [Campylobacteraceae bacterium]MDY5284751.1 hypothetical protein [Campylobacter sp.]